MYLGRLVFSDDEHSDKELKQIEADDQAIQTILLGLPEDIYAAEKKAKLFNEWERFTSNERESIKSYYHHFLKLMNDLKRNKHFPEKIASNLKFESIFCILSRRITNWPTYSPKLFQRIVSTITFRVILFSIHSDEWKYFQSQHQTALRGTNTLSWKPYQGGSDDGVPTSLQLSQNSKTPMLDHQDKCMMKAQHILRGRLLASFQDREHEGGDTRSQGGIKDNVSRIKITACK
nr:hypothetical protein [Tanacetum cinerariifolium]